MSRKRLRFIHSSDWHLERPLGGLADVSERLKPILTDAPYQAAERVVNTALAEQADFVVLAGDLLDVELTGPRGAAFLVRQFERLAARQIRVYWVGGRVDRLEHWPVALRLPDNVVRFSGRRPEEVVIELENEPVARIAGMNRPRGGRLRAADFWSDADGLPTIAVAHGRAQRTLSARGLSYWALGGRHARAAVCEPPHAAYYSGSPQARYPEETGSHGCLVVEIDDEGHAHARAIATDVARFCRRRITLTPSTTIDDLESGIAEQARELRSAAPDLHLFVSWTVNGNGPLIANLRRGGLTVEVLSRMRRRHENDTPIAWNLSLEVEPESAVPPGWLQHDSLLGDYLRSLAQFDGQGDQDPADLVSPLDELAERYREPDNIKRLMRLGDGSRRRVLQQAASLGVDFLQPDGLPAPSHTEDGLGRPSSKEVRR